MKGVINLGVLSSSITTPSVPPDELDRLHEGTNLGCADMIKRSNIIIEHDGTMMNIDDSGKMKGLMGSQCGK
jgi:hypothetical protein